MTAGPLFLLRPPRPGDMGWIVQRHGRLYADEFGYDSRFEGVVAEVVGKFLLGHDPARERCWIAERDTANVGCVLLVRLSDDVGKLRLLLVEPAARGLGIGDALVRACLDFARHAGYRKVTLWTHANLLAARKLYQRAGFRLVAGTPNPSFGRADIIDETWEIEL